MVGVRTRMLTRIALAVTVTAAVLPITAGPAAADESADLSVTVSDHAPVLVGEMTTFSIQVYNAGPQAATNVYLTASLSGAGGPNISTSSLGCSASGTAMVCHWTSGVDPLATRTVTVSATPEEAGELSLSAGASSDTPDPDSTNNHDTGTATVNEPDVTPPTISITHTANLNGWNNASSVSESITAADDPGGSGVASVSCTDTLSGIGSVSGSEPSYSADVSGEGVHGLSCTATDLAGNTSVAATDTVRIDLTKPVITGSPTPAANSNGWNNTDVVVSFSCADTGSVQSGIDTSTVAGATLSTEGQNQSVTDTGTCTDEAGNTADPATVSGINIDKTAPDPPTAHLSPAPNPAGWNNGTPVTVSWTDNGDAGTVKSGIDFCTGPSTLSNETTASGTVVSGDCTDEAGNTSASASVTVKIDTTAPGITWNGGPAGGASYYFGFVPAAPTCTATDTLSGPKSCTVTGYGTSVGPHTMTATALDVADNQATEDRSYDVLAWTLHGFYQPVDMSGVWNTVKGGSTVPLKFEVFAGFTELTDVAVVDRFEVKGVTCPGATAPTDDIEMTTSGGTVLRYDSTGGQFIQNWQTPKKPGACYAVTMFTDDGSSISANFKLK